jgi:hypothetical protein
MTTAGQFAATSVSGESMCGLPRQAVKHTLQFSWHDNPCQLIQIIPQKPHRRFVSSPASDEWSNCCLLTILQDLKKPLQRNTKGYCKKATLLLDSMAFLYLQWGIIYQRVGDNTRPGGSNDK